MNLSVAELFVILSIDPAKGRMGIDKIHFRYTLTGAILMDYLDRGEFTIENKRIVPSFTRNGDTLHDMIADRIMNSGRNRRIFFWINRLTRRYRQILNEVTLKLEKQGMIRIEQKTFLNIIPYKRYWFIDKSIRNELIELLREILLHGKQPGKKDIMLLGLVEASKAYKLLSRQRGDSGQMRKKNAELLKGDVMSTEISQAIKEVQAAIIASVTAASIAAHSSH